MNVKPLSAFSYHRRHKGRAALLISLGILITAGLYLMGALLWTVFIEQGRSNFMFLTRFSVVTPHFNENSPDPTVTAQIRANADVAQVIPTKVIWVALPDVMADSSSGFNFIGLNENDVLPIMEKCGATLYQGQLLRPGSNGLLLSEEVAANLDLQVGDTIDASKDPDLYGSIATPLEVVGILKSDVRLGILSLEFLNHHEAYSQFAPQFLIIAHEDQEAVVDAFLREEIKSSQTDVLTFQLLTESMTHEYLLSLMVLVPIIVLVTGVFTLVIVTVNWISNSQRLPEFGILQALGYSKMWLIRRLTLQTATLTTIGWMIGIGLSWLILLLFEVIFLAPRGQNLSIPVLLTAVVLTLPIPTAVIISTLLSVRQILSRLDPIAVVEQGERSQEGEQKRSLTTSKSSFKPLAPATFYKRHKKRALVLTGAMSLMIMAVALTIFLIAVSFDAQISGLGYLHKLSIIRPSGAGIGLDPGLVAQIKTQPVVERVIPVSPRFHMLSVSIPPFVNAEASPFGVYADDLTYLVELFGLELNEGNLPRPNTNELVISEVVAQNRDLQIGDVIGNPDNPAFPGAEALPAEFVIAGIFARSTDPLDENWLGFVSLEFLESHEAFPVPDMPPLMVVPKEGEKEILDDWLEGQLTRDRSVSTLTYRQELDRIQANARNQMVQMAFLESVIAIVAAIALAVLNYIFISQRQSEFGVLNALGYGRIQLVRRTFGETFFTTGIAWALSALLCLLGLLSLQFWVFTPLGLKLNVVNFTPWLFTLPIPVLVIVVTTSTVARTLSGLDPVSIIERR